MSHFASASKSFDEGDYAEDDEDMEEDDGYDCLSDYEGNMDCGITAVSGEGSINNGDRRDDGYASRFPHHHGRKVMAGGGDRHKTYFRRYRNTIPENSDDNRRDHHNHLERKRRASIKGSYCELREAIPSLRGSKASRAVTLQRAAEYIATLTKSNREHSFCVDELTRQNEIIERQVQDLYQNYQRLEDNEYAMTRTVVASQSGMTVSQAGPSASFNDPPISPIASSSVIPSTPMSAAPALICGSNGGDNNVSGGNSSCNGSPVFPIPVRTVSQQQNQPSTSHNMPSVDNLPAIATPSSFSQLSYAALPPQQQSSIPPNSVTTKSPVSATAVIKTNASPLTRLITLESPGVVSTASRGVPQRIRLSNSLSTSNARRPIVVVSTASSASGVPMTSAAFSALDTAVLMARAARPLVEQQCHQHVVNRSSVEVVSSSGPVASTVAIPISVVSTSGMALPAQVSGHPRRVVIVSAQHHQECPPPTHDACVASSKLVPN